MTLPSPRLTNLGLFGLMLCGMAFALYLQHYQYLDPCPLCIFQRVALMGVGFTALVAALHNPAATGRRIYAGLTLVSALGGLGVAARHTWLQHLPPEDVPACGPGLDYWMQTFPLQDVIQKVLHGSGRMPPRWTGCGWPQPAGMDAGPVYRHSRRGPVAVAAARPRRLKRQRAARGLPFDGLKPGFTWASSSRPACQRPWPRLHRA